MEGKTTSPATLVRELCETVGEALIEIAKTAKDMAMGEPEKKEFNQVVSVIKLTVSFSSVEHGSACLFVS